MSDQLMQLLGPIAQMMAQVGEKSTEGANMVQALSQFIERPDMAQLLQGAMNTVAVNGAARVGALAALSKDTLIQELAKRAVEEFMTKNPQVPLDSRNAGMMLSAIKRRITTVLRVPMMQGNRTVKVDTGQP